jgi:hypothetical protein
MDESKYQRFGLGVLQSLTADQFLTAFRRFVPAHRRIYLCGITSESDADIIVDVQIGEETWVPRILFECRSYLGLEDLGPHPDLRFAVELWRAYGADSYCDFHAFAGPNPPASRQFLAHVKGQWWVATVEEVPGAKQPGGESVRLVRPIELPGGPPDARPGGSGG